MFVKVFLVEAVVTLEFLQVFFQRFGRLRECDDVLGLDARGLRLKGCVDVEYRVDRSFELFPSVLFLLL